MEFSSGSHVYNFCIHVNKKVHNVYMERIQVYNIVHTLIYKDVYTFVSIVYESVYKITKPLSSKRCIDHFMKLSYS